MFKFRYMWVCHNSLPCDNYCYMFMPCLNSSGEGASGSSAGGSSSKDKDGSPANSPVKRRNGIIESDDDD